jgi:NAD(P)-dependent dehydrogenase (short-subunit alcohol dehydrogenase family)
VSRAAELKVVLITGANRGIGAELARVHVAVGVVAAAPIWSACSFGA